MRHSLLVYSSTISLTHKTLLAKVTYNTSKNSEWREKALCVCNNFKFDWLQVLESSARRSARLFTFSPLERSNGNYKIDWLILKWCLKYYQVCIKKNNLYLVQVQRLNTFVCIVFNFLTVTLFVQHVSSCMLSSCVHGPNPFNNYTR